MINFIDNGSLIVANEDYIFPDEVEEYKNKAIKLKIINCNVIGDYAFQGFDKLLGVEISNVHTIGEAAFRWCNKLETATFDNIKKIKNLAFYDCNLKTIIIPGTVKTIGAHAFAENDFSSHIQLKEGVECIKSYAFAWGKGTSSPEQMCCVYLPDSIKKIESNVFMGLCIKNIFMPPNKRNHSKNAFNGAMIDTIELHKNGKTQEIFVVPDIKEIWTFIDKKNS